MFKIKVWKGNSKELGFLKINEQGWSEVDENEGTVFILGVSEQGLKMCGEKRVEAGRLYIQVAANQKHFNENQDRSSISEINAVLLVGRRLV